MSDKQMTNSCVDEEQHATDELHEEHAAEWQTAVTWGQQDEEWPSADTHGSI